ncbi:MAG: ABC transporter permease [Sporolactobacillus sp.]
MTSCFQLIRLDMLLMIKKKTIWRLILLPPLFIFILGTIFGQQELPVKPFNVAIYNGDRPVDIKAGAPLALGKALVSEWHDQSAIRQLIHLKQAASAEQARHWLRNGTVSVAVELPADFSAAAVHDVQASVRVAGVYGNSEDHVATIQLLLAQFAARVSLQVSEREALVHMLKSQQAGQLTAAAAQETVAGNGASLTPLTVQAPEPNAQPISNMHYYAVAMVVLFSISTALVLVHQVTEERVSGVLSRMRATPLAGMTYIVGRLVGIVLAILAQMLVVIAVSRFVFNVHWGAWPVVCLITVIYAFAVGAVALTCGLLAKDQATVSGVGGPIMYVLGFLGGSMMKIDSFPSSLQHVQQWLPNGAAINAFLAAGRGLPLSKLAEPLAGLLLLGLIFCTFAAAVYHDGREMPHAVLHDAAHSA